MDDVISVYAQGVIAAIELFTLAEEELRQFVIYTYYDISEKPLYVGYSKSFYSAHFSNAERLSFFDEIEYVGFVFFDNEEDMKNARNYYIRARNPIYNKRKYEDLPRLPGLDEDSDDLVVSNRQMMHRWEEWLGDDSMTDEEWAAYVMGDDVSE